MRNTAIAAVGPANMTPINHTTTPVNLADYAKLARERFTPALNALYNGGAGDEHTLRANAQAWQQLTLWPRVLRALRGGHTATTVAGRPMAHPIFLAPVALQRLAHPDGEVASALAAAAQGAGFVLSTQSSVPMEDIARLVLADTQRGPLWFQLYWQPDRAQNLTLVQRAEAAGFDALVLTVDAPVQGVRDQERRHPLPASTGVHAAHGTAAQPHTTDQHAYCAGLPALAPTWDDVAWLQAHTRLPLWLKGVLHPADALQAAQLGIAGLIVSNHGGRTLDTTPPTAVALPHIAAALNGTVPLLVDGGIRRGTDVLKACALGASGVLIGRPVAHALVAGGAQGVAHMIRLLRDELEMAMALAGIRQLSEAGADLLTHTPKQNIN
ncbi:alpha-hydroxy acid oxidase [Ottowia sp.]|uniref:alpha-hydroxy acid oxidase n=1 Tax=Ottowia sp. TaxID=1898956 RepID=UPI003A856ED9